MQRSPSAQAGGLPMTILDPITGTLVEINTSISPRR
jgi:hypothetical protein